ncbi:MAG TPA: MmgE/PrpD family protein [Stellaceae bacterium]|jgi:2-methylcitrate dehydratase PrpD|nr:MmgE/PrpD family protein [Stellaceae bacterium]
MPSVSEQAAAWSAGLDLSAIPAEVVAAQRWRILDTLGVALAVSGLNYGQRMRAGTLALGGQGRAHILGFAGTTSAASAALANGAMASAQSFDDTHNATIVHVTASLLSACLALGEELDATGEEFMAAIIAGSELACRIGLAAPLQFHKRGWHPTGIFGAIGATYAASRLLKLDPDKTAQAVGIAGSFAAGIGAGMREGVESPNLHAGWAAQSGITAALLARAGHTGPLQVFESPSGLFAAHVQEPGYVFDFAAALDELGKRWECQSISLKPYPCAHVLHSFIDAILALRGDGLRASDVVRIRAPIAEHMIGIVCEPRDQKIAPQNDWQGRGSLPYTAAEALVTGRLDGTSYRGDPASRDDIRALAAKIEHEVDRSAKPNQFKGWVIAELKDGRVLECLEPYNRGSAERPLRDFDILKKFRDNAGARFDEARIADIENAAKSLDGPGAVRRLGSACSI